LTDQDQYIPPNPKIRISFFWDQTEIRLVRGKLTVIDIGELIFDQGQKSVPEETDILEPDHPYGHIIIVQEEPGEHSEWRSNNRRNCDSPFGRPYDSALKSAPGVANKIRTGRYGQEIYQIHPTMEIHIANEKSANSNRVKHNKVHWRIDQGNIPEICAGRVEPLFNFFDK
jgi:hypothetical protein